MVLRDYSWLCAHVSILVLFKELCGVPGMNSCHLAARQIPYTLFNSFSLYLRVFKMCNKVVPGSAQSASSHALRVCDPTL